MEGEGNEKDDVGLQKLRLIDINNEDDDFLIDFPLLHHSLDDFRLSVSNEDEESKLLAPFMSVNAKNRAKVHLKNAHHLSTSVSIEPARPSYLRKSLAWDDAFFTSAGVLDPYELSFINKGLNDADIDAHKHKAKTATKMTDFCAQNKMKIKRNSNNKTAIVPRSDKRDIKPISRSCDRFHKPEDQSKSASWITYDLKKNKTATTNESAKHAMLCKKPFSTSMSCDMSPGYLSSHKFSSPKARTPSSASHGTPPSAYPFSATKTDRRSKLSASVTASLSRTPLSKLKKEEMDNFNNASPDLLNTSRRKSSLSMQSVEMNSPTVMKTKDVVLDSNSSSTESRKRLKPSGLRQPLPTLGFFDEGKTTSTTTRLGLQFQYQKVSSSPPSIRKTPTPMKASSNLKKCDQTTVKGKKTRIGSSEKEKEKEKKKKTNNDNNRSGEMEMQINDLSRYFETIDLSNGVHFSDNLSHTRAPLVDKTSLLSCNRVESLAFTGKSMNVMLISKASKENSPGI